MNDACSSFAVGASKHVIRTVPVSITDRAGEPARVEDRTDLLLPRLLQSRPSLNQHAGALRSDRLQKRSRGVANLFLQCLVLIELVVARRVWLPVANVAVELGERPAGQRCMKQSQSEIKRRTFSAPSTSPCTTTENSLPSRCRG